MTLLGQSGGEVPATLTKRKSPARIKYRYAGYHCMVPRVPFKVDHLAWDVIISWQEVRDDDAVGLLLLSLRSFAHLETQIFRELH